MKQHNEIGKKIYSGILFKNKTIKALAQELNLTPTRIRQILRRETLNSITKFSKDKNIITVPGGKRYIELK